MLATATTTTKTDGYASGGFVAAGLAVPVAAASRVLRIT
jgi:hypothetical protein